MNHDYADGFCAREYFCFNLFLYCPSKLTCIIIHVSDLKYKEILLGPLLLCPVVSETSKYANCELII